MGLCSSSCGLSPNSSQLGASARRLEDALARAAPVETPPEEVVDDIEGFEEQADESSSSALEPKPFRCLGARFQTCWRIYRMRPS